MKLTTYAEEAVDLWGSAFSMAWGAFLLLPWQTFGTSPSYGSLRAAGLTEGRVGAWLVAWGLVGLVGVLARERWLGPRRVAMLMLAGSWWGLAAFFMDANPTATAWLTYGAIALLISASYARRW